MVSDNNNSKTKFNFRLWFFLEGVLDVVVSSIYRVFVRLNDALRGNNLSGFILKITTYFINKISRYYIKYYPPQSPKKNSTIMWPVALSLILINLLFDLTFNFYFVLRALNNKISWLSQFALLTLAYAYMVFSSLESCYSNSIAWYGILNGTFDDSSIRPVLIIFFYAVGIIEAILSSLYFLVTTQLTLVWSIPVCILLYFIPPLLQKKVDNTVQINCVSNATYTNNSQYNTILAFYIVTANIVGLLFQISSFTANISAGLPWLSMMAVTAIATGLIAFYVIHILIKDSYTMLQYIKGVNFIDDDNLNKFDNAKPAADLSPILLQPNKIDNKSLISDIPEDDGGLVNGK